MTTPYSTHPPSRVLRQITSIVLLAGACASAPASEPAAQSPASSPEGPFTSVLAVVPVRDHARAVAWYGRWIGRAADVAPADGVAEWQLANGGWLQVGLNPEDAGHTTVVVGVQDVAARHALATDSGVEVSDIQDYGVVRLIQIADPDGNTVVFAEETGQ